MTGDGGDADKGTILVVYTVPGDVNGDGWVDEDDLYRAGKTVSSISCSVALGQPARSRQRKLSSDGSRLHHSQNPHLDGSRQARSSFNHFD